MAGRFSGRRRRLANRAASLRARPVRGRRTPGRRSLELPRYGRHLCRLHHRHCGVGEICPRCRYPAARSFPRSGSIAKEPFGKTTGTRRPSGRLGSRAGGTGKHGVWNEMGQGKRLACPLPPLSTRPGGADRCPESHTLGMCSCHDAYRTRIPLRSTHGPSSKSGRSDGS